jgi:hypothetical protein
MGTNSSMAEYLKALERDLDRAKGDEDAASNALAAADIKLRETTAKRQALSDQLLKARKASERKAPRRTTETSHTVERLANEA